MMCRAGFKKPRDARTLGLPPTQGLPQTVAILFLANDRIDAYETTT